MVSLVRYFIPVCVVVFVPLANSHLIAQELRLGLAVDRSSLDAGDPIYIRLDITNESDEPTKIVPASLHTGHFEIEYHTSGTGVTFLKFFDREGSGFGLGSDYSVPLKPHQTVSYYYFRPLLYYRQMNVYYWDIVAKGSRLHVRGKYRPFTNKDLSKGRRPSIVMETPAQSIYVGSISPKDQALLDLLAEGKDEEGISMMVLGLPSGRVSVERVEAAIGEFNSNELRDLLEFHLLYHETQRGPELKRAAAQRKLDVWLKGQSEIKRNCLQHAISGMSEAIYHDKAEDLKVHP